MKTLFSISVFASLVLAASAADDAGFQPLFNGKDLTGWQGNPKLWSVEDGAITGKTGSDADTKISHNTFLVFTNGNVDNFELRFSYKITQSGNSGIQYRSKVVSQGAFGPIVSGYQADFEGGKTYSGILYEERGRGILALRGQKTTIREALFVTDTKQVDDPKTGGKKEQKSKREVKAGSPEAAAAKPETKVEVTGSVGDSKEIQSRIVPEGWNDYVIIAQGNHLQHFINGQPTADVLDEQPAKAAKSGVLALQIHAGPPMQVQFKDLRIKILGAKSAAGGILKKMHGKWVPVEVVMNGEKLTPEKYENVLLTVDGAKFTTRMGDRNDEGTLNVDESKSPAALDITRVRSNGEEKKIPAICDFEGDSLRVCYAIASESRPTEFKSEADSGTLYVVYKRE